MEPVVPGLGEDSQGTVQDPISLIQGGGVDHHQILRQLVEMGHGEENTSTALTMKLPRSYMPEIDTGRLLRLKAVRHYIPSLLDGGYKKELMQQICYSFDGQSK